MSSLYIADHVIKGSNRSCDQYVTLMHLKPPFHYYTAVCVTMLRHLKVTGYSGLNDCTSSFPCRAFLVWMGCWGTEVDLDPRQVSAPDSTPKVEPLGIKIAGL